MLHASPAALTRGLRTASLSSLASALPCPKYQSSRHGASEGLEADGACQQVLSTLELPSMTIHVCKITPECMVMPNCISPS